MPKTKVPEVVELFKANVHLGHQIKRWNPRMEPFIYEARRGVHIINLEKTHEGLKAAVEFLYNTAKSGKQIIFVGTKRQVLDLLRMEANHCGALYVNQRWLGGTLTNYSVIKNKIDKLANMRRNREEGDFDKYTKKERLLLDREIEKLENSVGGLSAIKGLPGALVVIDARREKTAVREANAKNIPVVALVDTDTDPTGVAHPIPGNDDAIKSVSLILRTLSSAIEKGYADFEKESEKSEGREAEKVEKKVEEITAKEDTKKVERKVEKVAPKAEKKVAEKVLKKTLKLKKKSKPEKELKKTSKKGSKDKK